MTKKTKIFLHVTKTAGGTLKSALEKTSLNIGFAYGRQNIEDISRSDASNYDLIYGHLIFGIHEEFNLEPNYICFLRHPVERTISHYYHLRNVDKGPVGERIRKSADIEDFFMNHHHWEFSNLMTKIVSGVGNKPVEDTQAVLNTAIAHIDAHFVFVGLQEFFPYSIYKLSDTLGEELHAATNVNIGSYDFNSIPRHVIERIESLNTSDLELYRHCINRFL